MCQRLILSIVVLLIITVSCSRKVMVAIDSQKMTDEHIILRKNGDYESRNMLLGFARIDKVKKGRYVYLRDTIYFVSKIGKRLFETYAWGCIDTAVKKFLLRTNTEEKWQDFRIEMINFDKLYRSNSHTVR